MLVSFALGDAKVPNANGFNSVVYSSGNAGLFDILSM